MTSELHQKIKVTREINQFSVDYMSSNLAIAESEYLQIEAGILEITIEQLFEIARLFHVTIHYFLQTPKSTASINNFNNRGSENKGNLIYNTSDISTLIRIYQQLIATKEEEIIFLKNILKKEL